MADNTEYGLTSLPGLRSRLGVPGQDISTTGAMAVANSALEASCHGPVTDAGHNVSLAQYTSSPTVCPGTQADVTTFNLGPLQNNGGPTQTMLPEPGSALMGAVPRHGPRLPRCSPGR